MEFNGGTDHVHLVVAYPPTLAISVLVKRLKGREGMRLRVGDWRVIFYEDHGTIIVAAVGHRRDIYN